MSLSVSSTVGRRGVRGVLFPEDMDDIFSPLAVSQTMSLSGIEKLLKNGRRQVREGTHDTCKLLALD